MEFGIMILNTSIPFNTGRRVLRACVLQYNLPRFVCLMSMYICMYVLAGHSDVLARHSGVLVFKQFSSLSASIASTPRSKEVYTYIPREIQVLYSVFLYASHFLLPLYTCNCTLYVDKVLCGCIQLVRWAVCMLQSFWNARCVYLISFYIYLYSMFVYSSRQKCLQLRRILYWK